MSKSVSEIIEDEIEALARTSRLSPSHRQAAIDELRDHLHEAVYNRAAQRGDSEPVPGDVAKALDAMGGHDSVGMTFFGPPTIPTRLVRGLLWGAIVLAGLFAVLAEAAQEHICRRAIDGSEVCHIVQPPELSFLLLAIVVPLALAAFLRKMPVWLFASAGFAYAMLFGLIGIEEMGGDAGATTIPLVLAALAVGLASALESSRQWVERKRLAR